MTALQRQRWIAKQHPVLASLVRAFCLHNNGRPGANGSYSTECVEHMLSTSAGDLRVAVVDDWIACQFQDFERAKSVLGVDHWKWNHGCGERDEAIRLFDYWTMRMESLIPGSHELGKKLLRQREKKVVVSIKPSTYRGMAGFIVYGYEKTPPRTIDGRTYQEPNRQIGPVFVRTREGAEEIRAAYRTGLRVISEHVMRDVFARERGRQ